MSHLQWGIACTFQSCNLPLIIIWEEVTLSTLRLQMSSGCHTEEIGHPSEKSSGLPTVCADGFLVHCSKLPRCSLRSPRTGRSQKD